MNFMWSMLNVLQLISFTLTFKLTVPDNVYLFFEVVNDLINMKVKFIKDWLDDILDSVYTFKSDESGGD